jgi:hypothetical protein
MDTATYAAIAALPRNLIQRLDHRLDPEAEFVPLNLSYIRRMFFRLFQATGPCNDL